MGDDRDETSARVRLEAEPIGEASIRHSTINPASLLADRRST